jgi:hypothetical protein
MAKTKPVPAGHLRSAEPYWISVGVTLRSGGGRFFDAPPERALVASPRHTFADLALAIDDAFGRWELGHRREFVLEDGTRVGEVSAPGRGLAGMLDYRRIRLQRLEGGERFDYTVDDGERWTHECLLVGPLDPDEVGPDRPGHPVVYQSAGRGPDLGRLPAFEGPDR